MQHQIPLATSGENADSMAEAVSTCIRCGFCLAACPTYDVLQRESDSPRGRIVLMKEVLEGTLTADEAAPHIDACLGCLACEPACPSGVSYRDLLSPYRTHVRSRTKTTWQRKLQRFLTAQTLPFPKRFRIAARTGLIAKRFRGLVPAVLRPMLDLLPDSIPAKETLPAITRAEAPRIGRVALLAGCAQQVLSPRINVATIDVLRRIGWDVHIPSSQGCCGSLAWHVGDGERAAKFAINNLRAFADPDDEPFDAIVTNAAGCGSGMHEYASMLRGTSNEATAESFASKVVDVSVLVARHIDRLRLSRPNFHASDAVLRVAYHDACHLANAQGIHAQPRHILQRVPGIELVDVGEAHLCCGSAGTYNLDQPDTAGELGQRKARAVLATGAEVVVSGNIGCLTQLQTHLRELATDERPAPRIMHTIEFLQACCHG